MYVVGWYKKRIGKAIRNGCGWCTGTSCVDWRNNSLHEETKVSVAIGTETEKLRLMFSPAEAKRLAQQLLCWAESAEQQDEQRFPLLSTE